jgi:hypothetical protein
MKDMMGCCGVECSKCPAYIATINNDDSLRKKYAAEQSEFHGIEIAPEKINCVGCCCDDGEHLGYCNMCEIRKCCHKRGLVTCAECPEYMCDELDQVHSVMRYAFRNVDDGFAKAKINLDKIRNKILRA